MITQKNSRCQIYFFFLLVLIIVGMIIVGIFASDWFFNRNVLTETLVGILIGTPLGWIGAYVAFYTVESQNSGDDS